MIINTLVRKVVFVEYALLRTPLDLFDRRVAARYLGENSTVRQAFGLGLGVLDSAAAHLLGHTSSPRYASAEPGAAHATDTMPGGSAPAGSGPLADAESALEDAAPDGVLLDEVPAYEAPTDEVLADEVERVAEELLEERVETPLSGELADESPQDVLSMTELRAKHIVEEYEQQQREKSQE